MAALSTSGVIGFSSMTSSAMASSLFATASINSASAATGSSMTPYVRTSETHESSDALWLSKSDETSTGATPGRTSAAYSAKEYDASV